MLVALAAWVSITVGWWALALWPMPGDAPEWLSRARSVCFNTTNSGLPDASGWLLLIGQPIGMLAILLFGWPRSFRTTMAGLRARPLGRAAIFTVFLVLLLGLSAATVRVSNARAGTRVELAADELHPLRQPRADVKAASLQLIDHLGRETNLEQFRGQTVLLTFAFGHCETVCPAVVRSAEQVRTESPAESRPVLLIVTMDPWRDTPTRLSHMATAFELSEGALVLGGSVDEVNQTLDDWAVWRVRDESTGDILHGPLVYIIDADGRLAFTSRGGPDALRQLLRRLESPAA